MIEDRKVIIVEGISDKKQLEKIIAEDIDIIPTHGTFSNEHFEEVLAEYELDYREVFIFVDADRSGDQLRKKLIAELSHAKHIYVPQGFKEVAATPTHILAALLEKKFIQVKKRFQSRGME